MMIAKATSGRQAKPAGGQFALVPVDLLDDTTLSRDARWLYCKLAAYADADGGSVFPAIATLAKAAGATRRSIHTWRDELLECGWLQVIAAAPGKPIIYRIIRRSGDRAAAQRIGRDVIERRRERDRRAKGVQLAAREGAAHCTGRGAAGCTESLPSDHTHQQRGAPVPAGGEANADAPDQESAEPDRDQPALMLSIPGGRQDDAKRSRWEHQQRLQADGHDDMTEAERTAYWTARQEG